MEQPKISVIIPAYNSEAYLEPCVRSVLQQTYQNLEILLIDDGSTDKTWELCQALAAADSRIRPIRKENGGVSAARNAGIDASTGALLSFLDADDMLEEGALESLLKVQLDTHAEIVAARLADGAEAGRRSGEVLIWTGTEALQRSLEDHPLTYSACGKLYTRKIVGQTRFQEDIRVNEDTLFVFQLLCKQPRFAGMDEVVYFYRKNLQSASRAAFSEKFFDILKVSERKVQIIDSDFPQLQSAARNMRLKSEMSLLNNLSSCPGRTYCQMEKQLLHQIRENKQYYLSVSRRDDILFFIMTHHLYYPFKVLNCLRTRLKK